MSEHEFKSPKILPPEYFYSSHAPELARELLGKFICCNVDGKTIRARITETECYYGESDSACHAHRGKTQRNSVLYQKGGAAYVYLCYGIHNLLNLVTGNENFPEAVLIRSVEGAIGPGRTTKFLRITASFNGKELTPENGLWVEDDGTVFKRYEALPRVGIDYAEPCDRERLWRFRAIQNLNLR